VIGFSTLSDASFDYWIRFSGKGSSHGCVGIKLRRGFWKQSGVGGATGGLPTLVAAIRKERGITQQARLRNVMLARRLPWKPTYLLHIKKPLFVHKGLLSKVGTVSLAIVSANRRGIRID
jgi:hypothetical protein